MIIITKKTERNTTAVPSQPLHRVTGKVVDVNGDPVIGASVQVMGQSMGTITNLDGEFTLSSVPLNALVVVSYIGFEKKEIKVSDLQKSSRVILREGYGYAGRSGGGRLRYSKENKPDGGLLQ